MTGRTDARPRWSLRDGLRACAVAAAAAALLGCISDPQPASDIPGTPPPPPQGVPVNLPGSNAAQAKSGAQGSQRAQPCQGGQGSQPCAGDQKAGGAQ